MQRIFILSVRRPGVGTSVVETAIDAYIERTMSPEKQSSEKIYGIYVIDLKKEVWIERKKKMQNAKPDYLPATGKGCVYVGMSKYTPRVRFQVHLSGGYTASPVVRDFGRRVQRRRSKSFRKNLTKAEAEEREPQIAHQLREKGYAVWPVAAGGMLGSMRDGR